jgi:glutathione S-transferase
MYKLYFSPGAASLCVHHALIELAVPHELIALDLKAGAHKQADYLALNPNGVVPTLIVDGQPMFEAAALMLLLAERHPESGLSPAVGSASRRIYLQWTLHLANTLQPAFRHWFYPDEIAGAENAERVKQEAQRRVEACFDRLQAHLAAQGPYMLGSDFSMLDIYAVMLMRWSRNMPKPATEWAACRALAERVKARPSWKRLYEVEGLTEWA